MSKRFKLEPILSITGKAFRDTELDEEGNPILELKSDSEGNPILQVPRDSKGVPIPNVSAEPVYQPRSKALGKDTLPSLLKALYLRMPELTRQDTIYGTKMFHNINAMTDGILELDEDVHDWIKKKLQDEKVGVKLFGVNLAIIEQALDNFERLN